MNDAEERGRDPTDSQASPFRLGLQEIYELPERNFPSLKGHVMRLERPIPHPSRERLASATNLPFPYAVTAVSNDDMKFTA
jgi:hypothetical protein